MSTSADRVRKWQARTALKSAYFEEMDKLRRRSLHKQFKSTRGSSDLVEGVREFFLAYPRCFNAPVEIVELNECTFVCAFDQALSAWEHTAGAVALMSMFDDIVTGEYHWNLGGDQTDVRNPYAQLLPIEQQFIDETLAEVDALKRLGLWSADKKLFPSTSVVKGA